MSKQVYISADYSEDSGDRNVVEELIRWGKDSQHVTDFIDMSKVSSGSVSNDPDCRICDLKAEFNRQINASSAVIIIVGDKTACRTAGSACERCTKEQWACTCTPYKHNSSGAKPCRVAQTSTPAPDGNYGSINGRSRSIKCGNCKSSSLRGRSTKIARLFMSIFFSLHATIMYLK